MSQPHRFTSTSFLIWGGLLIWMANFTFVYVFAALACARGFASRQLLGIGIVPLVTAVSCILTASAAGLLMWRAQRSMRNTAPSDGQSHFIHCVVISTGILAWVGTLYVLLPAFLLAGHCDGGA